MESGFRAKVAVIGKKVGMVETPQRIWAAQGDESKAEIVSTFIDANGTLPAHLVEEVARAIKYRDSTIRKARGDHLFRLVRKAADTSPVETFTLTC